MTPSPNSPTKRSVCDRFVSFFRADPLREGKKDRSYLLWSFLIPLSIMLILYVLDGVYPFGERSVLVLDANVQYVGFFEALRAFVYGDGSMLYSFSRSLGGEMMGIYAYYLASPLSYIVALFPESMMTEALFCMYVLKVGLCGLTFGIYLDSKKYAGRLEVILFSTLYALTSFAIVMQHNTMWTDNLILLPILTLGIERLVKYRRFGLYVFALSLSLLSNFYIGYMSCLYTLLYFLYYFYGYTRDHRNNPLRERGHYLRSLLRMGLYSLLSIGIAAIILLTVSYSLSFGKNDFTDPSYVPSLQFSPLDFFAKLLPGVYDSVEPEGLPFVYCGTLTLILVPLYFLNRRFARGERIAGGLLLLVFYISMSVSSLDMLWHGGQAPNWLNYRYAFFLCFIILVLASRAFCRIGDMTVRTVCTVAAVLLVGFALVATAGYEFISPTVLAVGALFVVVIAAILIGMLRMGGKMHPLLAILLACVVIAEVFYNGSLQLAGIHENVGENDRDLYVEHHEKYQPLVDFIDGYDDDFYRVEAAYRRVTNDPFELGYRGVSGSTSTLNEKTLTFLRRLGIQAGAHWSEYKGSTTTLDSLLGIKYVFSPHAAEPSHDYQLVDGAPDFVYENPYALPIAYAVSGHINDLSLAGIREPLARQNAMIRAMLGGETVGIFTPITPTEVTYDNAVLTEEIIVDDVDGTEYRELLSDYYLENKTAIESNLIPDEEQCAPDSGMTFTVTIEKTGALYFYIPTDYKTELAIYVGGQRRGYLFRDDEDHLQDLGNYTAGDVVTVELRMEKCAFFYYIEGCSFFYQEQESVATEALTSLAENGITLSEWSDTYFKGTIVTTEKRSTVFTTIPYDAGWIVTVDGVKADTYETLDALLAFDAEPGEHEIEMLYHPRCYVLGKSISLISLGLFLILLGVDILLRRGVICVRDDKTRAVLSVFFSFEDRLPEEPNELADEYMPLPPKKQKKDKAGGPAEPNENDGGNKYGE
ncbi:MAG: YfhO family protein [Clostridia bacterium]|nr:YfhO family protein [Clostridia bacterium]